MNSTSTHSIISPQTNHSNDSVHIPFIPYLDIQLPVTFAVKLLLDIIGALVNACLWAVCYRKQQTDPNAVGLIIIQLVSCWLLLDIMVFPIHDVVTFLYLFGYHVRKNLFILEADLRWNTFIANPSHGWSLQFTQNCRAFY